MEAETYTGIYGLHKYWSKKPANVVRRFIQQYSHVGDVVLDPFCGSGVGVAEAIFAGRKSIGIDINPIATFITRQCFNQISIKELQSVYDSLKQTCQIEINQSYEVQRGNEHYIGTHFVWKGETLEEIWYKKGRIKQIERPQASDIKLARSFSYDNILYFYPNGRLFHNTRINAGPDLHVHQLFTPRNLSALATLHHHISQIESKNAREVMQFCFTSAIGQASSMVFVVKRRGKITGRALPVKEMEKKEVGSWVIGFWIPREHFEINVWDCFDHRFRKILKAKQSPPTIQTPVREVTSFPELVNSPGNLYLVTSPAKTALEQLPDNSVDYVVTDPPHGDRIPYLELSQIWNGWLGFPVNFEEEIVVSDAKHRNKNQQNFEKALTDVLTQVMRVLKPNHFFSLIFNSLDDDLWIFLINTINTLHFKLESVDSFRYSANSVVQDCRKRGLKSDFVLTYRKVPTALFSPVSLCSKGEVDQLITLTLEKQRNEKSSNLERQEILNEVFTSALLQGKYCRIADIFRRLSPIP